MCARSAPARASYAMDPPADDALDALAACPASYEDCMARAPQEAHQLGTPNAAPMPLDGGRTAPVAAPQCAAPPFVDPWRTEADAAGDPMLCGDALAPIGYVALLPLLLCQRLDLGTSLIQGPRHL